MRFYYMTEEGLFRVTHADLRRFARQVQTLPPHEDIERAWYRAGYEYPVFRQLFSYRYDWENDTWPKLPKGLYAHGYEIGSTDPNVEVAQGSEHLFTHLEEWATQLGYLP